MTQGRHNPLPRRKWFVSRRESNARARELAVPEWLTSVSVRHECGKERVRDGLERGRQEAAAAVPSMNRAPPRGRHCGSRDGHGAAGLYPRPRSGRRDLDWGVQILVFEVDRGVLRQFEIQVVFLGKFLNFF